MKKQIVSVFYRKSTLTLRVAVLYLMFLFFSNSSLYAESRISAQDEKIQVTGTIFARGGGVLPGAAIIAKNESGNHAVTDLDGKYSILISKDGSFEVSFIGYVSQVVNVGGRAIIDITLEEDSELLDEVVVVGYGTQKKVNLTGSVAAVDVEELALSRPITNITQALAGTAPGVYVSMGNNASDPHNEGGGTIRIRGTGTLNESDPLIIIDGVEGSLKAINPQDIATMSILKDAASSAIYGSRAANGVVLITTKKGKAGTVKFEYNAYVTRFDADTRGQELVSNYADYMEYMNEGRKNSGKAAYFSQGSIDVWRENENIPDSKYKYPNTDFFGLFQPAIGQKHTLSVSGGSEKVTFYTSFDYSDSPGVIENKGRERFALRSNVEAKITKWLKIGTQLNGYMQNKDPGSELDWFTYGSASSPGAVYRHEDGRYGTIQNSEDNVQSNNPLARLNAQNGEYHNILANARMYASLTPLKGLTIQGSYSINYWNQYRFGITPIFHDIWDFQTETVIGGGVGKTSVKNEYEHTIRNTMDGTIHYERSFADDRLDFSILGGASQEQYLEEEFTAARNDLVDPALSVINGAVGDNSTSGKKTDWAMRSFFARLNLGWDDKYLLELNIRADGSSRFRADNRWGYFPSASVAWRISQEDFMENVSWLSELKLRGSYGSLGNNSVGNYDGVSTLGLQSYSLNSGVAMGVAQIALKNPELTWETAYMANVAVDFGFFKGKLAGTLEYYDKRTKGILISLPAARVHGNASIPKTNAAEVSNKGVEVSLFWNDQRGDFTYNVGVNFNYTKNNIEKFRGDVMSIDSYSRVLLEGETMNPYYIHVFDRIIQTEADLKIVTDMEAASKAKNNKSAFAAGVPKMGDILLKDLNGDGIVNDDDREIVGGGTTPKFTYGISLGFAWKGIDFALYGQGVSGLMSNYKNDFRRTAIRYGYQLNKDVVEGAWRPGVTNAEYPRLLDSTSGPNNKLSDFWVMSTDYFKIRNIALGYTLPKRWTDSIKFERIRIYASLENFFTFSKWKGFDPEVPGGLSYPAMKQASIGLNVTF